MRLFLLATTLAFTGPKEEIEAYKKKEGIIGIAVALVRGKEKSEIHCFGDTGHHTRVTIKPDTYFRLGRVTEAFTAALALEHLPQEAHAVSTLPRTARLPESEKQEIAVRDLLDHTSGLQAVLPLSYCRKTASPGTLLSHISRGHLAHPPGKKRAEAEVDYALLGLALCEKTKKKYAELFPLGKFELSLAEMQRRARGHTGQKEVSERGLRTYSPFVAERGLYATIGELASWAETWTAPPSRTLETGEVAGPFTVQMLSSTLMLKSYTLADRYLGYSAYLGFVPMTNTAVIILASSDCGIEPLGQALLESISSGS